MNNTICVDPDLLILAPMLDNCPDDEENNAFLASFGHLDTINWLRRMKSQRILVPAGWQLDLLTCAPVFSPVNPAIGPDGETVVGNIDFEGLGMDELMNDFAEAHLGVSRHFIINERSFTTDQSTWLRQLYFHLPVACFTVGLLKTYQYAALAWETGCDFYTRNVGFCVAANPELAKDSLLLLVPPVPERKMVLSSNGAASQVSEMDFSWIHLVSG
jgi:hypothetical protein